MNLSISKIYEKLTKEIHSFCVFNQKYQNKNAKLKKKFENILKKNINKSFNQKSYKLLLTGSQANSLALFTSNINYELILKNYPYELNKSKKIKKFYSLIKKLKFVNFSFLDPLDKNMILNLQLNSKFRNLTYKITIKSEQAFVPSQEELIKKYLEKYPISKPLYITLKYLLQSQQLDDPSEFGFTSFCIFLMIIAYV